MYIWIKPGTEESLDEFYPDYQKILKEIEGGWQKVELVYNGE